MEFCTSITQMFLCNLFHLQLQLMADGFEHSFSLCDSMSSEFISRKGTAVFKYMSI